MGSHVLDFLCLGKDGKQVIIGEEIETREDCSLGFKILFETSLDELKISVSFNEFL